MSAPLCRIPFAPDLLARVQAFDCGAEPWQREVSDWSKAAAGQGGALDELTLGNQVWLYATAAGEVVGFGSLGVTHQRWPGKKDPPVQATILPMLGVDQKFWGQPPGPPEQRFATLILGDLIAETSRHRDLRPILVLYVHQEYVRGIAFYRRAGFVELHKPFADKRTGRSYLRMVLVLPELAAPIS